MKRTIITLSALAVLVTATAFAAEIEKKDVSVQKNPSPELRVDGTAPRLRQSVTITPTVEPSSEALQSHGPESEKSLQLTWQPAAAE